MPLSKENRGNKSKTISSNVKNSENKPVRVDDFGVKLAIFVNVFIAIIFFASVVFSAGAYLLARYTSGFNFSQKFVLIPILVFIIYVAFSFFIYAVLVRKRVDRYGEAILSGKKYFIISTAVFLASLLSSILVVVLVRML